MAFGNDPSYSGRAQSLIKHAFLGQCLERFAA